MKTFNSQPLQLQKNLKWIPAGTLIEGTYTGAITPVELNDKYFDTREEADKYFTEHFLSLGYKPMQNAIS